MNTFEPLPFSAQTRDRIATQLQHFEVRRQSHEGLRRAAIAVTLFHHEGEAAVILTKRSPTLRAHSGQWALPGGRIDAGESAVQAALRELEEEINLSLDASHVLGTLDDYQTRSGYLITPVVIWADVECANLQPNPDEVASVHAITFAELARPDSPHLESIAQSDRQVLSIHYGHGRIYAPTAAVLYQFREVALHGNATRVLHFDQPVFAWQ
jgi:8-oxo-dGTP pyrophosphatase MutT (NUDIX family)